MAGERPLPAFIEHVVVLMFENRSFDNVLGALHRDRTEKGLYRGLTGTESNPIDPGDPARGSITVWRGGPHADILPYPDPGETFYEIAVQMYGSPAGPPPGGGPAPMSGFVASYARQPCSRAGAGWPAVAPVPRDVMHYQDAETMPITYALARQYAVCDAWFAPAPAQTLANRTFLHCGTPTLVPGTRRARLGNEEFLPKKLLPFVPPIGATTIFELLDRAYPQNVPGRGRPLNWKVYYHDVPLTAFCRYVHDRWDLRGLCGGGNVVHYPRLWRKTSRFEHDLRTGMLPKYSFIEPRYSCTLGGRANSNHPGGSHAPVLDPGAPNGPPPISVHDGEALLADVYNALARHPKTFEKTLLIVAYDEHGGLYDHVPPPAAVSPFAEPVEGFRYDQYGVRVPVLLVHPSIAPGSVYPAREPHAALPDPPFDHTSILSTLLQQFDLRGELSPRVASAPALRDLVPEGARPATRAPLPRLSESAVTRHPDAPLLRAACQTRSAIFGRLGSGGTSRSTGFDSTREKEIPY
jgi:phospholipase C